MKNFIGNLVLLIVSNTLTTFAARSLWNWFLVPAVHVPQIGLANVLGLTLLGNVLMPIVFPKVENMPDIKENCTGHIILALCSWGIGAVVHFYFQ